MKSNYFVGELNRIKRSFTGINKKTLHLLVLEIAVIAVAAIIVMLWMKGMKSTVSSLDGIQNQVDALGGVSSSLALQMRDDVAVEMTLKFITYTVLSLLGLIGVVTLVKQKLYNVMTETEFSFKTWWRFIVMGLAFSIFSFLVFNIFQFIIFRLSFGTFQDSLLTRAFDAAGLAFILLIVFYMNIVYFSSLVKTGCIGKSIKIWAKGFFKSFHKSILPAIIMLVVLFLLNLLMYPVMQTGLRMFFLVIMSVLMLLYIVWVRRYFYDLAEEVTKNVMHKTKTENSSKKPKTNSATKKSKVQKSKKKSAQKTRRRKN